MRYKRKKNYWQQVIKWIDYVKASAVEKIFDKKLTYDRENIINRMWEDYELTYFSPKDWSMWVEEDPDTYLHIRTQEGSFVAACKYLWNFGCPTFAECVEKYLLTIGVSQQDIDDIRKAMLL